MLRLPAAVRPSEVQAWVRTRADELAPSTVEVVYRYLAAISGAALRAGHPPVVAPPKTDASFRTIPLPAGVTVVMRSHLAVFPATTRPELGALVFTTPAGEPIRRNRFGDVWRAAVRRPAPART